MKLVQEHPSSFRRLRKSCKPKWQKEQTNAGCNEGVSESPKRAARGARTREWQKRLTNQIQKAYLYSPRPSDKDTFSGALASEYEHAAKDAGHNVERLNLGELNFDPILHKGYKEIQELESDLKLVQEKINWADHVVIIYPNWWKYYASAS